MSIVLEQLTKRYGGYPVVNHVSLEIAEGELLVLIGPSGSGKSTILRMIAGLNTIDEGRVLLHGRDVTYATPQQRGVGFVFQHYALFRHMSVAENIEFALRVRKVSARERRRRRDELLELVGLAGLGSRLPTQLSGGQQQRVALARALAHRPEVLLLDEPFGALDAKIRVELRRALRRIQTELGITTIHFPLKTEATQLSDTQRVQVLFRPEDVALAASPEALGGAQLGRGEVEQSTFGGSFERLRLRLPPLPGVRPIAPTVSFGDNSIVVEATRSQEQARRLSIQAGDYLWVGVRRIHALVHPGLNFLILTDGTEPSQAALDLGGQIARLAHARVTILGYGLQAEALQHHFQETKEKLGSGLAALEIRATPDLPDVAVALETERQPFDLVILGWGDFLPPGGVALAEQILQSGEHHLLLVPNPHPTPRRALVCVTGSEPSKDDVLFAGRLLRHLGAEATLLSILPTAARDPLLQERARRFLADGVRTLGVLGVPAETIIRSGPVREGILKQMQAGEHDLLVLGAPLTKRSRQVSLSGLVSQLLEEMTNHPMLIVHSRYVLAPQASFDGRTKIIEEIIP